MSIFSASAHAAAPGPFYLYTPITGANTTFDSSVSAIWQFKLIAPFYFGGGTFTIKQGGAPTDNPHLSVCYSISPTYTGGDPGITGNCFISTSIPSSNVSGQYTPTVINFASGSEPLLDPAVSDTYTVVLWSNTGTNGKSQYFIKGVSGGFVGDINQIPVVGFVTVGSAAPFVTLAKSVTPTPSVATGGTLTYTINLGNGGSQSIGGGKILTVNDQLPAGVTATSVTPGANVSAASCSNLNYAGALLTCSATLNSAYTLAAGTSTASGASFTITATAPNTAGSITNYAAVDSGGGTAPPIPGSSCVAGYCGSASTTVALTPANFSLVKTATSSVTPGGTISYGFAITNTGGTTSGTTAMLQDLMPTGLVITAVTGTSNIAAAGVSCSTTAGGSGAAITLPYTVLAATPLYCRATLTSGLAQNGTATFAITASVPSSATVGTPITNSASIDPAGTLSPGAVTGCSPSTNCSSASTSVVAAAGTSIVLSKSASIAVSGANYTVTYSLVATNTGAGITTSVNLSDNVPAALTISGTPTITVASGGHTATSATCSNAGNSVTCSASFGNGANTLSTGGTITVTIVTTAPVATTPPATLTNYASVSPSAGAAAPTPGVTCTTANCASAPVVIPNFSNLTLAKTASASVNTGGAITYGFQIGNSGNGISGTSVTIKDVLPAGVSGIASIPLTSSSGSGTCANTAGSLVCTITLTSAIAANTATSAGPLFTFTATANSSGSQTNYASIDSTGGNAPPTPGASCTPVTSCASATTAVSISNLTLSKTASAASVPANGSVTYTFTIGNSGNAQSGTSATVYDQLPAGVVATAVTSLSGGVTAVNCGSLPTSAGAALTCNVTLGASGLAASGSGSFAIVATQPATAGSITNYASVDPTGGSSPPALGPGCQPATSCGSVATTITSSPNYTLSKSATPRVAPGGVITYQINLGNSGTGSAGAGTVITVYDQVPVGLTGFAPTNGTGTTVTGCTTPVSGILACTVTLTSGLAAGAANGTANFTIAATVPATGVSGIITNYAMVDPSGGTLSSPSPSTCITSNCGNASTNVSLNNFTIVKTGTASVSPLGQITYTFTLGNSGTGTSGTNATVYDQLPVGVVGPSAGTAGSGVSAVSCTNNTNGVTGLVKCSVTLSGGLTGSGTAAFSMTAYAPNSGGAVTNYASVDPTGGTAPPTPGASCSPSLSCGSYTTNVVASPSLSLTKSGPSTIILSGGSTAISYSFTINNNGTATSGTAVNFAETLPTNVTTTAVAPTLGSGISSMFCTTSGTYSYPIVANSLTAGASTLHCTANLSSALAPFAAPATFTLGASISSAQSAGTIINYASINSDGSGSTSPPTPGASCNTSNCGSATTTVTGASLTIYKSSPASAATSGQFNYTLSVGNSGVAYSAGSKITVSDQLPAGVTAISVVGNGISGAACGNLNVAGALIRCTGTLSSSLPVTTASSSTVNITITATAPSSAGSVTNYATIDATGGTSPAAPSGCTLGATCGVVSTTITASPNLTLAKTVNTPTVATGASQIYTLTITNTGQATSGSTATLQELMPVGSSITAIAGVTDIAAGGVSCTVGGLPIALPYTTTGTPLVCTATLNTALATNATASFTITANAPNAAGPYTNYASVDATGGTSPGTAGSGCTGSCANVATTVNTPAHFTLAKTVNTATVTTGSAQIYTLTITNTGQTTSGTSATLQELMPTGSVIQAGGIATGSGVSAVSCSAVSAGGTAITLPYTTLANTPLYCTATLSSGLATSGTAAFTITANAPNTAGPYTNYASVDATGGTSPGTAGSGCTGSCANVATTVNTPASITLGKTGTGTVQTNGSITYTLTLGNSGGSASGTGATISEQLPMGVVATAVNAVSGISTVNCGGLPSTAGALLSCTVTLSSGIAANTNSGGPAFTITATAPGTAGSITNYASVDATGGSSPPAPGSGCGTSNCANASTTVTTPANFTLTKTGTSTVLTSGAISYTMTVTNTGGTTSGTSATVIDYLPAGLTGTISAVSGTGNTVSCGTMTAGSAATCALTIAGGLAPSGTTSFTIDANAPSTAGSITNYATIGTTGGTPTAPTSGGCTTSGTTYCASAATTVNTPASFTLGKTGTSTVQTNGSITYTLTLGNSGGSASGTSATISEQLPAGVVATAVNTVSGISTVNCGTLPSTAGALLTCTVSLSSSIAANTNSGGPSFTITATAPGSAGTITNYASVDATGGNAPPTPGSGCVTGNCANASTTVNTPASLTLGKTGTITVQTNGSITYTLTLGNSGGSTSGTTATISEQLPVGVAATAVTAVSGISTVSCGTLPSTSGALLTCTVSLSSGIAANTNSGGPSFTITATAPGTAGSITNYASVDATGGSSPPAPGSGCGTSNCANASTTVTTGAPPASFTLSKAGPSSILTSSTIIYTLTVTNSGGTASGATATISEALPTGLTGISYSSTTTAGTAGTVSCTGLAAGLTGTCTLTFTGGNLAAGASSSFTIDATAPGSAGSVVNYASVATTTGGTAPAPGSGCGTANCASLSTTVNTPANFTLAKTGTTITTTSSAISYTLTVTNSGGTASGATATISEALPTGLTGISYSGTTTAGTAGTVSCTGLAAGSTGTCTLTFTGGNLAAGASSGFTIDATAPGSAGSVVNYASVATTTGGTAPAPGSGCSTSNCASATTAVNTAASLTLTKTGPATAATSSAITYTLTLDNSGGSTSGTTATISEQLPAGVTATAVTAVSGISTVNCGGLPSVAGALLTCTVNLSSGIAANTNSGGPSFTITATAPGTAGAIINYASVDATGGNAPPAPGSSCGTSNCASASTTVNTPTNFTLSKTGASTVLTSSTITYTLTVTNSGGTASGATATISEALPAGLTGISYSSTTTAGTAGTVSCTGLAAGATGTCTLTFTGNSLAAAASSSFTITATTPATAGSVVNYASVATTTGGTAPASGSGCVASNCASATTTVNTPANFTLGKTGTGTVLTSGAISYTLTVTNSGGTASGATATISEALPAGLTNITASNGTGNTVSCGTLTAGTTVSCTLTFNGGNLAVGASSSFTINATSPSTSGSITNRASVDATGGSSPPTPGSSCGTSNCASAATTVNTPANFTLAKTGTGAAQISTAISYTLTVTNGGGTASGASATISEALPAGLTGISYSTITTSGTAGTVSCTGLAAGATGTCTLTFTVGNLAPAASSSFTISATAPGSAGIVVNYASVATTTGGMAPAPGSGCGTSNCATATSTIASTGNAVTMFLQKNGSTNTVELGDSLTYTLTLRNISASTQSSINISDTLPRGFTYIRNTVLTVMSGSTTSRLAGDAGNGLILSGSAMTIPVPAMAPNDMATVSYRVRVGVGSQQGDGVNRAQATAAAGALSNQARFKVTVRDGVFAQEGCLIGKIYVDCNNDGLQDAANETGIPGVRLYLENGNYVVSDSEGKYSLCGVSAQTHVLKADPITLPRGAVLAVSSNRNAGDPGSLFVDMKFGELHRADFIEGSCTPEVLQQVETRRNQARTKRKTGGNVEVIGTELSGDDYQFGSGPKRTVEPNFKPVGSPASVPGLSPSLTVPTPVDVVKADLVKHAIRLEGVNFETASDKLLSAANKILDEVVSTAKQYPDIQLEVIGHTDNRGSAATNQSLSKARAKAVKDYLVKHGIEADRISTGGYGASRPVDSNVTGKGRAQNRRVEIQYSFKETNKN